MQYHNTYELTNLLLKVGIYKNIICLTCLTVGFLNTFNESENQ